ncbi:hypothetical protein PV-S19_0367 [Pacmanvirus S19]|nr:hypothetical protein PV-S19_0367 [Pacmanvirus S19]
MKYIFCKRCNSELISEKVYPHYVSYSFPINGISVQHQIRDYYGDEYYLITLYHDEYRTEPTTLYKIDARLITSDKELERMIKNKILINRAIYNLNKSIS